VKRISFLFFCFFVGLLLLISIGHAEEKTDDMSVGVCYYLASSRGYSLPYNNCLEFEKLCDSFNISVDIKPIERMIYEELNSYEFVYLSSYGLPDGLFNGQGSKKIKWEELAKNIHVSILFIDACYAGYIFDYPQITAIIITSSFKSLSWNVILSETNNGVNTWNDSYDINISSFIVMLRCIYDKNFQCPIDLKQCVKYNDQNNYNFIDHDVCQFNLITTMMLESGILSPYMFFEDPTVGVSTSYINGKPWR